MTQLKANRMAIFSIFHMLRALNIETTTTTKSEQQKVYEREFRFSLKTTCKINTFVQKKKNKKKCTACTHCTLRTLDFWKSRVSQSFYTMLVLFFCQLNLNSISMCIFFLLVLLSSQLVFLSLSSVSLEQDTLKCTQVVFL